MCWVVSFNPKKKIKIICSVWVKDYRQRFGHLPLLAELRENYSEEFKNYLRMDSESFDFLLALVSPKISEIDTVMRKSITTE